MRSVKDILDQAQAVKNGQQARIEAYKTMEGAYFGESVWGGGSNVRSSNSDGRPSLKVLTEFQDDLASRRGAPNLLIPIVRDFVAVRGRVPSLKVAPEGEDEQARETAAKRSRALRSQWDNSRMVLQQEEAAWYMSVRGDSLYLLDPVFPGTSKNPFKPPGIYINVQDPMYAYPVFGSGHERHELHEVFLIYKVDKKVAERQFGVATTKDEVEVVQYYGTTEKRTLVDGKQAATGNVEHGLEFCPAEWVRTRLEANRFARGDIADIVDLHMEWKAMFHLMTDALVESVYSTIVVVDPNKVAGDNVVTGPGEVIEVMPGGDVKRLEPNPPPVAAQMVMGTAGDNIVKIAGAAPIRLDGTIDQPNTSGRAIKGAQTPMYERVEISQETIANVLERVNGKVMLMWHGIPEFKKAKVQVVGRDKGKPYSEEISGELFGGWWRNDVKWDATLGQNLHEKLVMALQLHGAGLVPDDYVLERIGEDDADRLVMQRRSQDQQKAQQQAGPGGAPGGAPGGGPGGPPPPDQVQAGIQGPADAAVGMGMGAGPGGPPGAGGLAPPGVGPVQPPPPTGAGLPSFPPMDTAPTQPGMGRPASIPDVGGEIDQVLATVRLYGEIVQRHPTPNGIKVEVTDHRDVKPIKDALTAAFPGKQIDVKIVKKGAKR